ncbi:S41 family peptidase [Massilia sp.]|uniref:S41 family peptidase n=1 Tax=Massilia sp. TaxID=1882437 RepID=UPI0028A892C6|nr:S41 family peptidase [Massilia sp.]
MRQCIRFLAIGMLACAAHAGAHAAPHAVQSVLTPEQLRQDLQFIRQTIAEIHPEPGITIAPARLEAALDAAQAQLSTPMDRDAAWRVLGKLNPQFADAHLGVFQPGRDQQVKAHLAAGGGFFPYEVRVTPEGDLFIRAELGGKTSTLARTRIEHINGVPANQLVQELLQLVHGDTAAFRAEVLSRRFWFYYWKVVGAPASFTLVQNGKQVSVPASSALPELFVGADPADFDKVYRFELLGKHTALLTIKQFGWPDKDKFYAFTQDAFARMRAAGVTNLLIDVRENGGGDDDMWKTGILPYIATRPYRHTSTYVKKVIPGRGSATEKVGDVIHGTQNNWEQPQLGNPLLFKGRVYVLVGGMTYSSAVLFSNVMQDFGFAQLVGARGYARARQSGGIQIRSLPNTKLELVVPRFVLDRPSGARTPELVTPDIVLADDPFDERVLVDALLQRIEPQ